MTTDAILAIDAGTTGVTTLLVGHDGAVLAQGYREMRQIYPQPGWVEHDADDIWQATLGAIAEALAAAPEARPIAIGIANQRETCLFWDRKAGRPLHNAIVWQCRRSAAICDELRARGLEPEIAAKTGLRLDPYFSGTKALWLTRNDPSLAGRIAAGNVAFGTIDTWLAFRLSGNAAFVTDTTNACRTLAFDIHKLDWDDGLLELFGLDRGVMAEVGPSSAIRARTKDAAPIPDGLPIAALVGDQQAALFGQSCFGAGLTKATYGTGCFILMHTGDKPIASDRGLLTTLAATAGSSPASAFEGSIFAAGAAVQWCRDNLGVALDAAGAAGLAEGVPDSDGTVFVPAFTGLGSPHWAPDARAAIFGMTRGTTAAHLMRAALESMAFQVQDVLNVMSAESGFSITELRVDGGAAANDLLMQLQADLSGVPVSRPRCVETTALGAVYLAGLVTGFWQDKAEIAGLRHEERRFTPSASGAATARDAYARWQAAVAGLLGTKLEPLGRTGAPAG